MGPDNPNIKCENCKHYISHHCFNESSPKYNTDVRYWNRCKAFTWKFSFDGDENDNYESGCKDGRVKNEKED